MSSDADEDEDEDEVFDRMENLALHGDAWDDTALIQAYEEAVESYQRAHGGGGGRERGGAARKPARAALHRACGDSTEASGSLPQKGLHATPQTKAASPAQPSVSTPASASAQHAREASTARRRAARGLSEADADDAGEAAARWGPSVREGAPVPPPADEMAARWAAYYQEVAAARAAQPAPAAGWGGSQPSSGQWGGYPPGGAAYPMWPEYGAPAPPPHGGAYGSAQPSSHAQQQWTQPQPPPWAQPQPPPWAQPQSPPWAQPQPPAPSAWPGAHGPAASGAHTMPPPQPPGPLPADGELANLLLAWYYSGYYTGRYQAQHGGRS